MSKSTEPNGEVSIAELTSRGVTLPPQPRVLLELQSTLSQDDYDVKSVADIVSKDPGIVAALFRVARSPAFSRQRKVDTVEQVVMLVGARQVFNLVQAVSLAAKLSDKAKPIYEMFWQRADGIARMATLIAKDRISICNVFPEQAYLAGMFHECGVPVLMQRFPEYCGQIRLRDGGFWPDLDAEDEGIGMDHCAVGYFMAKHWKLPDFICRAVMTQHELPTEELGAVASLVAILQLGSYYYHRIHHVECKIWTRIGEAVLKELCIHPAEELDFFEKISDSFNQQE